MENYFFISIKGNFVSNYSFMMLAIPSFFRQILGLPSNKEKTFVAKLVFVSLIAGKADEYN